MNLIQFFDAQRQARGWRDRGRQAHVVKGATSVYALASEGRARRKVKLKALIKEKGLGKAIDPAAILAEGRMLPPIDHPDPAICGSPARA